MVSDLVEIRPPHLTPAQYSDLSDVPPEVEWLANITNAKTRRAYKEDVAEFVAFTGLKESAQLRTLARAHVIAWRKDMEARSLSAASIRRKLSALASLFNYLCERNAVLGNPVDGVKRPLANSNEGSTPALGDAQVRRLLDAPPLDTLKGVRDRAILAALLYHGLRCDELCQLRVKDMQSRQGVMHFKVRGKRDRIRFVPIHPVVSRLIAEYMEFGKHGGGIVFGLDGPLFRPVANNRTGTLEKHLFPGSVYYNVVIKYAKATGISSEAIGVCVHSTRSTAATNALANGRILAKCRNGWGMRMFQRPASTTGAKCDRKTVRRFT